MNYLQATETKNNNCTCNQKN